MKPSTLVFALIVSLSGSHCALAQRSQGDDERAANLASKSFRLDGGLINAAEGEVRCLRRGMPIAGLGTTQDFESGDTIETGEGRAELLLNPGYYLRLDAHTKVVLADTSPVNLKVEIPIGSVGFEIEVDTSVEWQANKDAMFAPVTVVTPRDEFTIVRAGAFRFAVDSQGRVIATVAKGLVMADGVPAKSGKKVYAFGGIANIRKYETSQPDAFDEWNRGRASASLKSNKSLKLKEWYRLMDQLSPSVDISNGESVERSNDPRTVSARNGAVTYTEIGTSLKEAANSEWRELTAATTLLNGDRLRTALHTRAEIHPYPFVYSFVGGDTELEYREAPDGQASIILIKGSIVTLIPDIQWKKQSRGVLKLVLPDGEYEIDRDGYYRANVRSDADSEMLVYYGSINAANRMFRAPIKLVRDGGSVRAFGLDRKAGDNLDIWSLRRRGLIEFGQARLTAAGIWFLNSATNEYTFLPAKRFYKSPYGGEYSVVLEGEIPTRLRPPRDPFGSVR